MNFFYLFIRLIKLQILILCMSFRFALCIRKKFEFLYFIASQKTFTVSHPSIYTSILYIKIHKKKFHLTSKIPPSIDHNFENSTTHSSSILKLRLPIYLLFHCSLLTIKFEHQSITQPNSYLFADRNSLEFSLVRCE